MVENETKSQATAQFIDGLNRKIVTGDVIDDQETYIIIETEHARYRLNKSSIDWIKYNKINNVSK